MGAFLGYAIGDQISKSNYPNSSKFVILKENSDSLSFANKIKMRIFE